MNRRLCAEALDEIERVVYADAPLPRLIHMIYMTGVSENLPAPIQRNLEAIERKNPGWSVTLYGDAAIEGLIVSAFGPRTLEVFRLIHMDYSAARADFFRYLCVFASGGVYLDIKSTTVVALDEWIMPEDRFILSQWPNGPEDKFSGWGYYPEISHIRGGEYMQWFIVAAKGHPYLRAVLREVVSRICLYRALPLRIGRAGVRSVTGPIPYSLAVESRRSSALETQVDVLRQGLLAYSIFDDENGHHVLFKKHYSMASSPIVPLYGWELLLFRAVRAVGRAEQRFRRSIWVARVWVARMRFRR